MSSAGFRTVQGVRRRAAPRAALIEVVHAVDGNGEHVLSFQRVDDDEAMRRARAVAQPSAN